MVGGWLVASGWLVMSGGFVVGGWPVLGGRFAAGGRIVVGVWLVAGGLPVGVRRPSSLVAVSAGVGSAVPRPAGPSWAHFSGGPCSGGGRPGVPAGSRGRGRP